jgi:hypothetical protein
VVESRKVFAQKFMTILKYRNAAKELFDLFVSQSKETNELAKHFEQEFANLMEMQSEEMMATSLDGTPDEITTLVNLHVNTRAQLETRLLLEKQELRDQEELSLKNLMDKLVQSLPASKQVDFNDTQISSSSSEITSWPRNTPALINISKLADLIPPPTPTGRMDQALSAAQNIGKKIVRPWVGLMPESLSLIGMGQEALNTNSWGVGLPIAGLEYMDVQLGTTLKVSFRLMAIIARRFPCNIVRTSFDEWCAHSRLIYSSHEMTGILMPNLGPTREDIITQSCRESPEWHFAMHSKPEISIHSNLVGANIVIRASDVKAAIAKADECNYIARVAVPIDAWSRGTPEVSLLRKIKEALVEASHRRYVSGSRLCEIALLAPSNNPSASREENQEWLSKMKLIMAEIFEV